MLLVAFISVNKSRKNRENVKIAAKKEIINLACGFCSLNLSHLCFSELDFTSTSCLTFSGINSWAILCAFLSAIAVNPRRRLLYFCIVCFRVMLLSKSQLIFLGCVGVSGGLCGIIAVIPLSGMQRTVARLRPRLHTAWWKEYNATVLPNK